MSQAEDKAIQGGGDVDRDNGVGEQGLVESGWRHRAAKVGVLFGLVAAVPLLVAASDVGIYDLYEFEPNTVISSSEMNANFTRLGEHAEAFESALSIDQERGFLGIGLLEPEAPLDITQDGSPSIYVRQIGDSSAQRSASLILEAKNAFGGAGLSDNILKLQAFSDNNHSTNSFAHLGTVGPYSLRLFTNETIRMFIKDTGNIGIGTTAPAERLDVVGNVKADEFLANSDRRLKREIEPLANGLNTIQCLDGVSYRWRDDARSEERQVGLVAQDVEACLPEVVATGGEGLKSVAYGKLVVPLIEAVKEQQQIIDTQAQALEAEREANQKQALAIAELEARLDRIEQGQ